MAKLDPALTPLSRADLEVVPGIRPGTIIAEKYRVLRAVGRGGMGVVLAASQLSLERTVAIKLIRSEWAEQSLAVERLLREAKAAASIQSEHVARVLDVGTLDSGEPFIVMEYLEGNDLDTLLRRDGPLPASLAVDYLLQGCEAIAEAHRNGIVHRDLKPANVFIALGPGGTPTVKVVDFGISKIIGGPSPESLTQPSRVVGSLFHMAPEQMRGRAVDARTDVWALGLLLFEMLTGKRPYRDAAWPDVCARVLSDAAGPFVVPGEDVPRELSAVIQRCLERQPGGRYQNVAELAVALAPFGGQSSSMSLERIVRVATSTGSLAARTWTPLPPDLSRSASLRDGSRHTPIIPASDPSGPPTREPSTREPVVTSAAAPGPRQRLWLAAALGIAAGAAGLASWRLMDGVGRSPPEPALAVQPLSVASEPPPPVVETPEGTAEALPPPTGPNGTPSEPRISVLRATEPAAGATTPEVASPTPRAPAKPAGAAQAPRPNVPAPTPAPGPPEIIRDDSALTEPSAAAANEPPNAAARAGAAASSSAPASAPAGSSSGAATTPSGAPNQTPSNEAPAPAPATPGTTRPPKTPDAWDLSDIDFKSSPGPNRE